MKKLLSLALSLALVFSLTACGGGNGGGSAGSGGDGGSTSSSDTVHTVSLQFTFPESNAAKLEEVLHEIETASNGRLKFEVYYSFSMVANGDVVDALQDGTLDIAGLMPNEFSLFPLNGHLCALPMLGFESNEAANKIYLSLLYNNEAMMAEFTDNDLVFWAGSMCPGYQMFFAKDVTDTTPNVFSGLTIMSDNPEMQAFIASKGGAVAAAYPPDFYSNLSNGVAEGLVQHLNCVKAFGCVELTKTNINFGEGFYNTPIVYCMNENFWNSLPEDLQQIMADYADDISRAAFDNDAEQLAGNKQALMDSGAAVIDLDESQMAVWTQEFQSTLDSALDNITTANSAAPEVYEQLTGMIDSYDAASFQIGTTNFGTEFEW